MTESEIHDYCKTEYAKQLQHRRACEEHKNRNHVQAKLTDELYRQAYNYCRENNLNFNSFTRLSYSFFLQHHD